MYGIIDKINNKSYVNIEDLLNVAKEVPFLLRISEKQEIMLRTVMTALEKEYGERLDIKICIQANSYRRFSMKVELIIRYDVITIKSTDGLQHTTKELYVIHPLSFDDQDRLLICDRLRVFSTHFTLAELHNKYVHSHISDSFVNSFVHHVVYEKKGRFNVYNSSDELCLGSSKLTQVMSELYEQDITEFIYYFNYVDHFLANEHKSGTFGGKKLEELKAVINSANHTDQYKKLTHAPTEISNSVRTWLPKSIDVLLPLVKDIRFTGTKFEIDIKNDLEKYLIHVTDSTTIYNTIDKCYYEKNNNRTVINLHDTRNVVKEYANKGTVGIYFRNEWVPITLEDDIPESIETIQEQYVVVLRPETANLIAETLNKTINQKYYEYRCEAETCI